MAHPLEKGELFNSNNNGLPLLSKILAPLRQVINFTIDDDDNLSLFSKISVPLK